MMMDPAQNDGNKSERRVALVIGNGAYANAVLLDNPRNDARAMAAMLRGLDFEVIDGVDLDVDAMDGKINEFAGRIRNVDTALFFFAGHGLQVDDENYLVPVDAKLDNEGQLQRQTIRLQDQLNMMTGRAGVSILLLDCCRDNPFVRSLAGSRPNRTRGGVARGLAEIGTDEGAFIAFATGPGSVAREGEGVHSPFTEALLRHIGTLNSSLADIMTDVTATVKAVTGRKQVPWYHSSLSDRFYFRRTAEPNSQSKAKDEVALDLPAQEPAPVRVAAPPTGEKSPTPTNAVINESSGREKLPPAPAGSTQKPRSGLQRSLTVGIILCGLAAAGGLAAYIQTKEGDIRPSQDAENGLSNKETKNGPNIPQPAPIPDAGDPRSVLSALIQAFQFCGPPQTYSLLGPVLYQTVWMQTGGRGCYQQIAALGPVRSLTILNRTNYPNGPIYTIRSDHQAGTFFWQIGISLASQKVEYLSSGPLQPYFPPSPTAPSTPAADTAPPRAVVSGAQPKQVDPQQACSVYQGLCPPSTGESK